MLWYLIVVIFLGCSINAEGQRYQKKRIDRFAAGVLAGYTFSQLDGDNYTGYHQQKPYAGIQVSSYLSPNLSFDVNFLYIRKGSTIENEEIAFRASLPKDRKVHLSYIEVPLLLKIIPHGEESKLYFETGVSIGRMIDTHIEENVRDFTDIIFTNLEPEFNKTDIAFIAGIGSDLTKDLALGARFSYSLNKLYTEPDGAIDRGSLGFAEREVRLLRNYYVALVLSYRIF